MMAAMAARRTLAERQAQRQRYRERAIAEAALMGLTARCRDLQDDLDNPEHQRCQGESSGGAGCLCRCHDVAAATAVVSRCDEKVGHASPTR